MLKNRRLGRTNLQVSELSLGTYMLTGDFGVSRADADAIFDTAINLGINYMDTAEMYGYGESEELVGRALVRHAGKKIQVSTKVGVLDRTIVRHMGAAAYQNEDALLRAIKHSFWLLRRDFVEVLMIHEPHMPEWGLDLKTGDAPIMRVLEKLKAEGAIGGIGVGCWLADLVADLIDTGRFDVALVAGGMTIIRQPIRQRVVPIARKHDVGLVMGGTFLQGRLAVKQRERFQEMLKNKNFNYFDNEKTIPKYLAAYDLSDQCGISLTDLAIRYILADPDIATMIPGAQKPSEVEENVRAAQAGPLPADVVKRIEEISAMPE